MSWATVAMVLEGSRAWFSWRSQGTPGWLVAEQQKLTALLKMLRAGLM
jgi:hypothetical protein